MTVEHVTLNEGGQAIVGNVSTGGGGIRQSEDQPHAKPIAYAASEAVPSEIEPIKDAVPSPAIKGFDVCRMHGARGGAPKGNQNPHKHGLYSETARVKRQALRDLLSRALGTIRRMIE